MSFPSSCMLAAHLTFRLLKCFVCVCVKERQTSVVLKMFVTELNDKQNEEKSYWTTTCILTLIWKWRSAKKTGKRKEISIVSTIFFNFMCLIIKIKRLRLLCVCCLDLTTRSFFDEPWITWKHPFIDKPWGKIFNLTLLLVALEPSFMYPVVS